MEIAYIFPMSANSSGRTNHLYGILAKVPDKELKSLRVAVRRRDITGPQPLPSQPTLRDIDDPRTIVPLVHTVKKGKIQQPKLKTIFDRDGVLVNQADRPNLPEAEGRDSLSQNGSSSNSRSTPNYSKARTRSRSRSISKDRRPTNSRDRRSYERISSPRRKSSDREVSPKRYRDSSWRRRTSRHSGSKSVDYRDSTRRSKDRGSPRQTSVHTRLRSPNRNSEKRRRSSSRRRSSERGRSPRRKSRDRDSSISRDRSSRERTYRQKSSDRRSSRYISKDRGTETEPGPSRYRSRSPRRRGSPNNHRSADLDADRKRSPSRERDKGTKPSSYTSHGSRDRRERSLTPLKPGEYRPNHPDLKRKLEKDSERKKYYETTPKKRRISSTRRSRSGSATHSRRSSRSPGQRYRHGRSRSPRPPEISSSPSPRRPREYESRRGQSSSSQAHDVHFGDPNVDYGYYEGIPPPEFWIHPGMIRPGYPVPRFFPPAYYPRPLAPVGPMMYPPRYPVMQPILRQRFPIYNNRQKIKQVPVLSEEGSATVCTVTSGSEGNLETTASSNTNETEGGMLAIEEASTTAQENESAQNE